jgi:hypothetical protein
MLREDAAAAAAAIIAGSGAGSNGGMEPALVLFDTCLHLHRPWWRGRPGVAIGA